MDSSLASSLAMLGAVGAVVAATAVALVLRPWRALEHSGPPWPWVAIWALMPLAWSVDRLAAAPEAQLLSLAPLLVLLAGWPLTVLALLPVGLVATLAGGLDWAVGLQRLVWLGLLPATAMLGLGALVRRWLPHHLLVYILGRAFFGTLVALAVCGGAALALQPAVSIGRDGSMIAILLTAYGEALVSGMLTAALVVYEPRLLATYTDRLYLPK